MAQRSTLLLGLFFSVFLITSGLAAEKLKVATPIKTSPMQILPPLTAQEKGFWKEEGVDAVWFPFIAGRFMSDAIAAGAIHIGLNVTTGIVQKVAFGSPEVIVAQVMEKQGWYVYVRGDSKIKGPQDLKGAKMGFSRYRSLTDAMTLFGARKLGIEREVKFVAAGGVPQAVAALKVGAIDTHTSTPLAVLNLQLSGEIRPILDISSYFPEQWSEFSLFATRPMLEKEPDIVGKVIRGILKANQFIMKNPAWTINKMKTELGWSELVAQEGYKLLQLSLDGAINKKGLENVRNFMVEYNLVAKDKTPPLEALYTDRFVRAK